MSVGVTTVTPRACLKRLLDEPHDDSAPKCKLPRPAPPTSSSCVVDPSLCLLRPPSPAPQHTHGQSLCSIGPYVLIEPCEGAETYRAVHRLTEQQYTCKVLPLRGYQERLAPYARLARHRHGNVGGLSDVVIGREHAYVFLPGGVHGDLHAYVRERKRLAEDEARGLFAQAVSAVRHCHRHGVLLRQLKLRMFVFTDRHRTKLSLQGLDEAVLLHGDPLDDSLTDRHGCPAYVAPELLTNRNTGYSGRAADVWSLGVCLYTMLIGRYPFQDMQPAALFAKIQRGAFSLPDWLSPRARSLIGCLLRKCPAERLLAAEISLHPWMVDTHTPHDAHAHTPRDVHAPRDTRVHTPRDTHVHTPHNTHASPCDTHAARRQNDDQVVPTMTGEVTHRFSA